MLLPVIEEPVPGLLWFFLWDYNKDKGVDSIFRIPAGEYELAKREISIFLLFRKIRWEFYEGNRLNFSRYSLIKTTKHSPQFIDDYNSGLRKENESNYWEENKFYPIGKIVIRFYSEYNREQETYSMHTWRKWS